MDDGDGLFTIQKASEFINNYVHSLPENAEELKWELPEWALPLPVSEDAAEIPMKTVYIKPGVFLKTITFPNGEAGYAIGFKPFNVLTDPVPHELKDIIKHICDGDARTIKREEGKKEENK